MGRPCQAGGRQAGLSCPSPNHNHSHALHTGLQTSVFPCVHSPMPGVDWFAAAYRQELTLLSARDCSAAATESTELLLVPLLLSE